MANPAVVACPENQWTKVATNVQTGRVHILKPAINYAQTYRMTGDAAPADLSEAVPLVGLTHTISATAGIDVYIYARGGAGSVRVDL